MAVVGPGLAIAATGVGAGDLVTVAAAGSRYGLAVAWAALAGALLKFVLNEGLARWQLATGTTLLEGWAHHLGRPVQYFFLAYLVVWSFVVGGALISACGMAAHALAPALPVRTWGILHSLAAAALVATSGYHIFETVMKWIIVVMFVTLVGSALWAAPAQMSGGALAAASIPTGGVGHLLGVIGGVGGSVTLLSYGYWIRERRWEGLSYLGTVRIDLAVAYLLTGLFGMAVVVLAARGLHDRGIAVAGNDAVTHMAAMLEPTLGVGGRIIFLVGFWGAVSTSMLGVWQGVPYLFCDFIALLQPLDSKGDPPSVTTDSTWYRGYLAWLALAPMALLYFGRPVAVVIVYSVLGALFMPFLAGTLLYLGRMHGPMGETAANRRCSLAGLLLCLLLFGYLALRKITTL